MRADDNDRTQDDSTQGDRSEYPPVTDKKPRVTSQALFRGARRLVIEHNGQNYILQITRAERLILTK